MGTYNTRYIVGISFISALGGYLFGFDFAVISGALPFLQTQFGLNAYWEGFATGCLALGAIAGCLIAGKVSDRYGRRKGLLLASVLFGISALAMALSPNRNCLITARFMAGIGVGMASMLSPMYIAEISPAPLRGRMVAINQLTVVIGILLTNLVNYALRNIGPEAWRWMFGLGVVPSALFFVGALWLPESPRWLTQTGKPDAAGRILEKIGGPEFARASIAAIMRSTHADEDGVRSKYVDEDGVRSKYVDEDGVRSKYVDEDGVHSKYVYEDRVGSMHADEDGMRSMHVDGQFIKKGRPVSSGYAALLQKAVLPAVLVGIGLAVFQQLCGINVVFNYTPRIFKSIGVTQEGGLLQTVFIGGVNLVFTLLAMFLVDKVGRKPLMLLGAGGLAVLYLVVVRMLSAGSATVSWFLLSAIGVYALTLAPVTWVLISEVFPGKIRGAATSVAVLSLWAAYFVLVFTFPILFDRLGDATFYIYSAICALGLVFVSWKVKETKGKTLEEIEDGIVVH